ncbi:MAG: hypothetical protein AAF483_26145, partial [Planctomycetota bacterium]
MPGIELIEGSLAPELMQLIEEAPLPSIGDEGAIEGVAVRVPAVTKQLAIRGTLAESGLWLLAGELDRSHSISQNDGSAEGSFWHGIMHRREGDFGNSKYWFRRVGAHPVHDQLKATILSAELLEPTLKSSLTEAASIADAIVDACHSVASGKTEWQSDLQEVCWWEWQLL